MSEFYGGDSSFEKLILELRNHEMTKVKSFMLTVSVEESTSFDPSQSTSICLKHVAEHIFSLEYDVHVMLICND